MSNAPLVPTPGSAVHLTDLRKPHKHRALYVGEHEVDAAPPGMQPGRWWRIDRFRAFAESGVAAYVSPTGQPVVERVIDPNDPNQVRAQRRVLDLLDREVRIYAITPQLLDAMMDAADRAYLEKIDVPPWPVLPLWVEWPGAYLGAPPTEPAGFTIGALLVTQEPARNRREDGSVVDILITRVTLIGIDNTQKFLLYLPDGTWAVEQEGPCTTQRCSIARRTKPRTTFWVRERGDQREALECACRCYFDGSAWARILWAMMHLLSAQGIEITDIDRHIPIPPKPKSPKQLKKWQTTVNRAQAHNRQHPPIRHIGWSELTGAEGKRWHRVRGEDGSVHLEYQERPIREPGTALPADAEVRAGVVKRGHPRLLIADGRTRWKPPTRVVAVRRSRPYSQRVRTSSNLGSVRLVVEVDAPVQPAEATGTTDSNTDS